VANDGHHPAGPHHRCTAADAVCISADHHRAKRAHEEADAKCADCQQQRGHRIFCGEELLPDHDREEAVNGEIEHFDSGRERCCDNGFENLTAIVLIAVWRVALCGVSLTHSFVA
jgi:hypothetical protein